VKHLTVKARQNALQSKRGVIVAEQPTNYSDLSAAKPDAANEDANHQAW